ncbi:MAG: 5'(3')-deoxyribonucleotidase [Bacteroidota bacterium]
MERIAIDMDEVMADAVGVFLKWYERDFGEKIDRAALIGGHVADALPKDRRKILRKYVHTPGFFSEMEVMEGAVEVIQALQGKYEIYIASAAQQFRNSLAEKHQWLETHFPFISWKNWVFCGDKSILQADILIDDHVRNLQAFRGKGILYTSTHNTEDTEFPRVNNWQEVADMLL